MIKHRWKTSALKNQEGFTMVELIVTFALLGMLMVSAGYVITAGLSTYYKVKNTNYAQTVSDTLLDKVSGEIAGAHIGSEPIYTVTLSNDNSRISLYNRYGSPIIIYAGKAGETYDGQLVIHYRPLNKGTDHEKAATDWVFDQNMYMNYKITRLSFEQYKDGYGIAEKGTNVIIVDLVIKNEKNGFEYEQKRYVRCYNFTASEDVDKISYGTIPAD